MALESGQLIHLLHLDSRRILLSVSASESPESLLLFLFSASARATNDEVLAFPLLPSPFSLLHSLLIRDVRVQESSIVYLSIIRTPVPLAPFLLRVPPRQTVRYD